MECDIYDIYRYISAFNEEYVLDCNRVIPHTNHIITWSHLKDAQKAKYIPSVRRFLGQFLTGKIRL